MIEESRTATAGEQVLSIRQALCSGDSKTIQSFDFHVPAGTPALKITIDWNPRASESVGDNRAAIAQAVAEWKRGLRPSTAESDAPEDVSAYASRLPNLLNVILVDPEGVWRGRTDRGRGAPGNPLVLVPGAPPLGFIDGPLTPGRWTADLEIHAVVEPGCEVELDVAICPVPEEQGEVTRPIREDDGPEPAPGESRWFRGELHSHSTHSDGAYPVAEIVRRAESLGLDFLALTDHNTLAGAPELDTLPFPTIQGVELTTFHGHHVVLGAQRMVPWHVGGQRLDVSEVAARFRAQGALYTLTHPFSMGDPLCTGCRWTAHELSLEHVDLVEIWHRRWVGDVADNPSAHQLWNDLWLKGHRPTAVAARDWHARAHEAELPGPLPVTAVCARSLRQGDLLDGLRKGAVYLTTGPEVDFQLACGSGPTLGLGERAGYTEDPVVATVRLAHLESALTGESARVEIFHCGHRVATRETRVSGIFEFELGMAGAGWYRTEIWSGDSPLAMTNHVELY